MKIVHTSSQFELRLLCEQTFANLVQHSPDWGYVESDYMWSLQFAPYILGGNYSYVRDRFVKVILGDPNAKSLPVLDIRKNAYKPSTLYIHEDTIYGIAGFSDNQKVYILQPSLKRQQELRYKFAANGKSSLVDYVDATYDMLSMIQNASEKTSLTSKQLINSYVNLL